MMSFLDSRATRHRERGMMGKKNPDLLYILASIIIILILSVILAYVISFLNGCLTSEYRKDVRRDISEDEFIQELLKDNIDLKNRTELLESAVAEKELIIGRLAAKLNMSSSIKAGPFARIGREDILVYDDRVVINVNKAFPVYFTESKSMYPFINQNVYAIEMKPEVPDELEVGDVIGYESKLFNTTIVHRITETGFDEEGWYALTKGDANPAQDPEKVRFRSIRGVLIGLIY
jgi:hypothetical protein